MKSPQHQDVFFIKLGSDTALVLSSSYRLKPREPFPNAGVVSQVQQLKMLRKSYDGSHGIVFLSKIRYGFLERNLLFGEDMMSSEKRQFSRQDLLVALEKGWKHYLSRLKELSEDEQARYAHRQGFSRLQDVLVHIFGWWELSMQRSFQVLSGQSVPIEDDMDAFNAEVVARYEQWTREAVEATFATTLTVFEHFLTELPETAFEHEHIHLWLRIDAIDHYEDHRLPNAPPLQDLA